MDLSKIRKDIAALLPDRSHDDGSYAPLFIRLSWHCSATYDKEKRNGGSNGGTMRFQAEQADPENKGLVKAIRRLEPIFEKYKNILSIADILVLAGTVAIEATGGPRIRFATGRQDFTLEEAGQIFGVKGGCPFSQKDGAFNPNGSRLPPADLGEAKNCPHLASMETKEKPTIDAIRNTFCRLGFNDKETVCLIILGHQYGRCHPEISGYENPWYSFDPTTYSIYPHGLGYMTAMVMCKTRYNQVRSSKGKRQWEMRFSSHMDPFMMLVSDMALVWDEVYYRHVVAYDRDRIAFREDAAKVWKKLIELGCKNLVEEKIG
eukprot:g526.t1